MISTWTPPWGREVPQVLNFTLHSLETISMDQYSQRGGETACFDWSLLSWRGTLDFCAASVDTWRRRRRLRSINIHLRFVSTWAHSYSDVRETTYCEHSAVLPLLWKSIIHWIRWLFSSSSCDSKCRRLISRLWHEGKWPTLNKLVYKVLLSVMVILL